ncbi:hypothetical protein BLNAU_5069 [Blattamonas nauphoetae]|uniref:Uncharacterized protein n=1 Tax=Blattamonas nauphoetae TaxID=2049346 RepID=A0ABQ9Y812_9EUKA|nr:hypothetical protein BLNAU_5069 [Blattamonas nauphoetae]
MLDWPTSSRRPKFALRPTPRDLIAFLHTPVSVEGCGARVGADFWNLFTNSQNTLSSGGAWNKRNQSEPLPHSSYAAADRNRNMPLYACPEHECAMLIVTTQDGCIHAALFPLHSLLLYPSYVPIYPLYPFLSEITSVQFGKKPLEILVDGICIYLVGDNSFAHVILSEEKAPHPTQSDVPRIKLDLDQRVPSLSEINNLLSSYHSLAVHISKSQYRKQDLTEIQTQNGCEKQQVPYAGLTRWFTLFITASVNERGWGLRQVCINALDLSLMIEAKPINGSGSNVIVADPPLRTKSDAIRDVVEQVSVVPVSIFILPDVKSKHGEEGDTNFIMFHSLSSNSHP